MHNVKIGHKKMAAKGGRIHFMFRGPPYPAAGSATDVSVSKSFLSTILIDIKRIHVHNFKRIFGGHMFFYGATDTPVLDFWYHILVIVPHMYV